MGNPLWLAWPIRLVFIGICFLVAWLIWLATQRLAFPIGAADWRWLDGAEIASVLGITIAVFGGIQGLLRWLAAPRIKMTPHTTTRPLPIGDGSYAVHHVEVWNTEWWGWLRPLVMATAPEGCQIAFRYWKEIGDREELQFDGKWLLGRWSDNPEPITGNNINLSAMVTNRRLPKLFPSEEKGHRDAYPFVVAFSIKRNCDTDCYHFNDESYQFQTTYLQWCNPDWKLGLGVYRVEVRLTGYGLLAAKTATLWLRNLGDRHHTFTLASTRDTPTLPWHDGSDY